MQRFSDIAPDGTMYTLLPEAGALWLAVEMPDWGWEATYKLAVIEGELQCTELRLGQLAPSEEMPVVPPLSKRAIIEHLALGEHLKQVPAILRSIGDDDLLSEMFGEVTEGAAKAGITERAARRRRRGKDDRWFAELAERYVTLAPISHKPIEDLATEYDVTTAAMRDYIRRARQTGPGGYGVLTKTRQGRPGGMLTDRGRELLKDRGDQA